MWGDSLRVLCLCSGPGLSGESALEEGVGRGQTFGVIKLDSHGLV